MASKTTMATMAATRLAPLSMKRPASSLAPDATFEAAFETADATAPAACWDACLARPCSCCPRGREEFEERVREVPSGRVRPAERSLLSACCLLSARDAPEMRVASSPRLVCEPLEDRVRVEEVVGAARWVRRPALASRRADWPWARSRRWLAVAFAARSTRRLRDPLEFGFAVFGIPVIVLVHTKLRGRTHDGTLPRS